MPYTANVPLANQQISASQPIINANFQSILAAFNANHTDLLTDTGRHSFIQLVPQAPTPVFAGVPGFWVSNAAPNANAIMLHNIAGNDINISSRFVSGAINYTYLPSGVLIKYGTATTPGGSSNLYIDLDNGGAVPSYTVARFAQLTGKHVPHFVVIAEDVNNGAHPVLRYLYVSCHDAAGAPQAASEFNWMTIGI